ncbi:gamma-butyrobetaine dioxygenase isoform X2 [Brienomyrus brachyistius]|uniref:gamma-butyrobetaine dioxygenase isoform X2 n=1 Tax=Brienomyrus brachyistius TaxID=42636 RepID=UPI0020B33D09|nr:gamma-butyrobetaine dioxygenase isoform X2 [Brienomyrus brachyistius]
MKFLGNSALSALKSLRNSGNPPCPFSYFYTLSHVVLSLKTNLGFQIWTKAAEHHCMVWGPSTGHRMWTAIRRCFPRAMLNPRGFRALRQLSGGGQASLEIPVCPSSRGRCYQHTLAAPLPVPPQPMCTPSLGIKRAMYLERERQLEVTWEDGSSSRYPLIWLRDNCQCAQCMLQSASARSLPLSHLDMDTGLERVLITEPSKVSLVWPDQHISEFHASWLKKRCFSSRARQEMQDELFLNQRVYWGSELQLPTTSFQEVLHDDKTALAWLATLRRTGIVYLKGASLEQGQVAKLSQRIGYLRLTFYGHTWQVQDKPTANNVAYTSGDLSLHTDYPALHHPPGVQFLHCLSQAQQGGDNEVVDGFHVAYQLRQQNPEAFRILSSLRVDFTDTGSDYCDFAVQSKHRIIDVDSEGQVVRINYNNATRDSVLDLPLEQVQPFYSSLRAYVDLMTRPENVVTYRMEPGDIITFDNWRLLHGRRTYTSDPACCSSS